MLFFKLSQCCAFKDLCNFSMSMTINDRCFSGLLCYDCATKYRSIWFWGQTWVKSIPLTTAVDFGLSNRPKMTLCFLVCLLQGYCSLTTIKVSGCHTAYRISPHFLRGATFTPPLAKSMARLLSV